MYLIEIDELTGNIKEDPTNDAWKGISVFRKLVSIHGIKGLTTIAFVIDYLSPFNHYSKKDRPKRAMDEIYGNRNELNFNDDCIKNAMEKYSELQFNPDLEQESINNDIKIRLLNKLREANSKEDDSEIATYNKRLQSHEMNIKNFNDRFDRKKSIKESVTNTGYTLTRIENDIKSRKNSKFVNHGTNMTNPNKLNLT